MSHACCSPFAEVESRRRLDVAAIVGKGLSFAATPVFALMALWSGFGAPSDMMCGSGGWSLGGMATMDLMMSAAHLTPWLGLVGRRRSAPHT